MKVIVIGAGAAGLYAGYLLKAQSIDVQVLEARPQAGGRIHSDHSFSNNYPIEWGAAYLHGHNHVFFELADYSGINIQPEVYADYYYWKGKILSHQEAMEKKKLKKAINFFKTIHQYQGEEQDLANLLPWVVEKLPMAILDGLAYEYGCGFKDMGAFSLAIEDSLWPAKGGNYWTGDGISKVFQEIIADLGESLQCNVVVSNIAYDKEGGVTITCNDGTTHTADKAIVTVPLSVLKSRTIQFSPSLPESKQEAIDRIGIGAGMKVFFQFDQAFWPKDFTALLGGEQCPLYEIVPPSASDAQPTLKAYIMGSRAQKLSSLTTDEVEKLLIEELDEMFGDKLASKHLIQSKVIDWLKQPYIWGAYSYAAPNSVNQRWQLALPLEDTLYFAGEATHFKGYPATVQGAMESASWAVEALLEENPVA